MEGQLMLIFLSVVTLCRTSAIPGLSHYTVIHSGQITTRLRRNVLVKEQELNFRALEKDYNLVVEPDLSVFGKNFGAYAIAGDSLEQIDVDFQREFFKGSITNDDNSWALVHIDPDGAITGSIWANSSELIHIEPAWRHLKGAPVNASIVYKSTDVRLSRDLKELKKRCRGVSLPAPPHGTANVTAGNYDDSEFRRVQFRFARGASDQSSKTGPLYELAKNRCPLKLVADYRFYKHIGGENSASTVRYLISTITRVNQLFTETVWRDDESEAGFTNMGLSIRKIVIHQHYTRVKPGAKHYNMENSHDWNASQLLQKFTETEGVHFSEACLAHLFTYRRFPDGILGLGYISHRKLDHPGGVCSTVYSRGSPDVYPNTALNSGQNSYGESVVTREADLVIAHEFGHNFGSQHDIDTPECSPNLKNGGPYLMYSFSVSGYDPNNNEESTEMCGNMKVEGSEECDAGLLGDLGEDPCCTKTCKLKPGALCSHKNSPCCSETCDYKLPTEVCREASPNQCKLRSYCSGVSFECPEPESMPDGNPCLARGECEGGVCVPFCSKRSIGLKPCICERETDSCYQCCWDGVKCGPYINPPFSAPLQVAPGSKCIHGYCDAQGKCKKEVQDFAQRFWSIIENFTSNSFKKFLFDNVVAVVVILSLMLWLPVTYAVHKADKLHRMEKEEDLRRSEQILLERQRIDFVRGVKPGYGRQLSDSTANSNHQIGTWL